MNILVMILLFLIGLSLLTFIVGMFCGIACNSIKWTDFWTQVCAISIFALFLLIFMLCAVGVVLLGKGIISWIQIH